MAHFLCRQTAYSPCLTGTQALSLLVALLAAYQVRCEVFAFKIKVERVRAHRLIADVMERGQVLVTQRLLNLWKRKEGARQARSGLQLSAGLSASLAAYHCTIASRRS